MRDLGDGSRPDIAPLQRSSLRDEATRALRSQIIAGTIHSDRLYAIRDMAGLLGTSPTPVREALLELEYLGLVELVRNRGFRVRETSYSDLKEILEMRLMLEIPPIVKLAELDTQPDLSQALKLCKKADRAAAAGNVMEYLSIDRDFHLSLVETNGNRRLVQTIGNLRDQTRLYGIAYIGPPALASSAQEHFEILDAIRERNPRRVRELLQVHLEHVLGDWSASL